MKYMKEFEQIAKDVGAIATDRQAVEALEESVAVAHLCEAIRKEAQAGQTSMLYRFSKGIPEERFRMMKEHLHATGFRVGSWWTNNAEIVLDVSWQILSHMHPEDWK